MRNHTHDRKLLECHGLSEAGPECDHNHHNFLMAELGTGVRKGSTWDRDAKARLVSSGRPVLLELAVGSGEPSAAARRSHIGVRRVAAAMASTKRSRDPRRTMAHLTTSIRRAAPMTTEGRSSTPAMCIGLINWPYLAVARSRRGGCHVLRNGRWRRIATGPLSPPGMAECEPNRAISTRLRGLPQHSLDTRWTRLDPQDTVLICSDAVAAVLNTTPRVRSTGKHELRKAARELVRRAQRQEPTKPATALLVRATTGAPLPLPVTAAPRRSSSVRLEVPLPSPAATPVAC